MREFDTVEHLFEKSPEAWQLVGSEAAGRQGQPFRAFRLDFFQ